MDTHIYASPVRRSLLSRETLGGIPQVGFIFLIIMAAVFIYGLSMYLMIIPIVILYVIMKVLSKKDQFLIDMVIDNLSQKDVFLP